MEMQYSKMHMGGMQIVLYCIVFSGEQTHPQFHSKYVHSQIFVAATIYKMSQLLHQVYNLTI
jgi:hypothetical protein